MPNLNFPSLYAALLALLTNLFFSLLTLPFDLPFPSLHRLPFLLINAYFLLKYFLWQFWVGGHVAEPIHYDDVDDADWDAEFEERDWQFEDGSGDEWDSDDGGRANEALGEWALMARVIG
jgi:hypothetical protein